MSLEALLAVITSAGIVCLILGVDRVLRRDRTGLDKRLRRYGGRAYQLTDDEQKQAASVAVTSLLAKRVEASISGRTFAAALQTDLARANLKLTIGEFLILQVTAALAVGAGAWLLSGALFVGSLFGAIGWFIPKIWLGRRQGARLKAFNNQLADTIALMGNSLRSGLSLVQSMEMISREAEPPVSEEFQRVVREIGLGVGPQDALLHLVRRVDSDDLELLVTAILVQFEIGGNLSRILDSIASTIRERVKLQGEIRTMSAQGRMAGYVLSGMPIAIGGLLMLIAPSYMGALFTPGPWLVLPVAGFMGVVMGSLVIRKLVAIDV
jgi:tight adherence protein B